MENKNKLKHVSFAGIDRNTDREELRRIQDEFPMVEFGVLMSCNWFENGNRYMSPSDIERFSGLNLCAHLCGKMARDFMKGDVGLLDEIYPYWKTMFKRIQVNVAPYGFLTESIGVASKRFISSANRTDMTITRIHAVLGC